MQLSRNVKQNGGTGIIAIVTVIAVVLLRMYGGEGGIGIEFDETLAFKPGSQSLPDLLDQTEKEIVPVQFKSGMVLSTEARLQLMGDMDLDVKPGDVLVFRKENDNWIEVGRYLIVK